VSGPSFRISLSPGEIAVKVNDVDVSASVQAVQVFGEQMVFPQVVLTLLPEAVEIEGTGAVSFRGDESLIDFLDTIDPKELEAEALKRSPYGESLTVTMVELLKELAAGATEPD
jgi:hypothetical protein